LKTVICVPRKSDTMAGDAFMGRRDWIWRWLKDYLAHHVRQFPISEGYDHWHNNGEHIWSLSKARNNAAKAAGDWDIMIGHDADFLIHPWAYTKAVRMVVQNPLKLTILGDTLMRMDRCSSDRILHGIPKGGLWFPRPDGYLTKTGLDTPEQIFGEPSSGAWAISRELWERTGGFVESMNGWGYEDLVFLTQCHVVGEGIQWVPDSIMLHFWHEKAQRTEATERNRLVANAVDALSRVDKDAASRFLLGLGHQW
jgi:hypothetical protein